MRKYIYILAAACTLALGSACAKLDINPLSETSSENWYKTPQQVTMSLNDLYRIYLYSIEKEYWTDRRTDDWAQRDQVYEMCNGSSTSSTSAFETAWSNTYKGISRAIRVIESIEKLGNPSNMDALKAEAYFFRAFFYARMVTLWGDVPFYTSTFAYEEAFKMGRTDKNIIKEQIYKDYDAAIAGLPVKNDNGGVWRVTKGTALSMKARYALAIKDYAEAAARAKDVIDLGEYSLYPDYGELFRDKTINQEIIFAIGRSFALAPDDTQAIKSWVLRTAGGNGVAQPSWDLLAAYECTDGKIINDSPLFDPHNPYDNRDPRCCETFAKPGSVVFGVVFNPSTTATEVFDEQTGKMVKNKDTKLNDNYAPYNGCCIRKGVQPEWRTAQYNENPIVICRYADVLLMYAEAKMEMNDIDQSVLNVINDIRARAYKCERGEVSKYPAVTTTDQAELRKIIRRERRVELAWEGIRWFDLQRWGLLKKCYSVHYYGLLNKTGLVKYEADGNWFWPEIPMLDEDGFADFTKMYEKKLIEKYGEHKYDPKVELFPIPEKEVIINENLHQNPGY